MSVALGLIGFVAIVVGFLLPRRFLPVLAIAVLVLVPVGYMEVPRVIGRYFSPAVILIVIWLVRLAFVRRSDTGRTGSGLSTALWLPLLGLLAVSTWMSVNRSVSVSWIIVVAATTVFPYMMGRRRSEDVLRSMQTVYVVVAVFLGLLAASDYLFGFNPWTSLFSYDVNEKVWSVFRTRTSLGHPLVTAAVSSVCVIVALFGSGIPRLLRAMGIAGAGLAIILAVSRTSVLAVGLGIALGCLIVLFGPSREPGTRRLPGFLLLVAGAAFLLVVFNSPLLAARNESTGGIASGLYRSQSVGVALSLISEHWLTGTGPGTSPTEFSAVYDGPLENSALQLVLSLGVPFASAVMLVIGLFVARIAIRGEAMLAAILTAFIVSLVGFSAIDVNPAMLAVLSPILYRAGQVLGRPRFPVPNSRVRPRSGQASNQAPRPAVKSARPGGPPLL